MVPTPKPQETRAAPPRIPPMTPALQDGDRERQEYITQREQVERRSVLRGLIVLALLVLLLSMWHAGVDRVFIGRWWWP